MPKTKTFEFMNITFNYPPSGKFGDNVRGTLSSIIRHPEGIALYKAMGLRGRAKSYEGRYRRAFINFAEANDDILEEGKVGPRGGFGYRLIKEEQNVEINEARP
jgi:hypothetical protein